VTQADDTMKQMMEDATQRAQKMGEHFARVDETVLVVLKDIC
jgi:hypothetical protein